MFNETAARGFLTGYKTYLLAAAAVIAAILGFIQGDTGMFDTVWQIGVGLGLVTARKGMKTETAKVVAATQAASAGVINNTGGNVGEPQTKLL